PLQPTTAWTAGSLLASLNGSSALGGNAVQAIATYVNGRFRLYVPSYTADQSLTAAQGIFVLSRTAGTWLPSGDADGSRPTVTLKPGWNLVAAPYPYAGLNGDS